VRKDNATLKKTLQNNSIQNFLLQLMHEIFKKTTNAFIKKPTKTKRYGTQRDFF